MSPVIFLIVLPWATVALLLALSWTGAAFILPAATRILDPVLEGLGAMLDRSLDLPWTRLLAIPSSLDWWGALLVTAGVGVTLLAANRWVVSALVGLTLLACVLRGADEIPDLVVLDVGQGDAIVLRDGRESLLVDGGGWQGGDIAQRVLVPALARLGIRRLSGMVVTHPDIDHCAGLLGLTSYISIDRLWLAPGWAGSDCVDSLLVVPGLSIRWLWRGERLAVGRWRLTALHPAAGQRRGRNDRSLVLLARLGRRRVVLAGDLESRGEAQILAALPPTALSRVDLLKVGHHGSDTSTSEAWLERLRPRLALISCGLGNRYGHPSSVVLERLRRRHVRILRTDRDGAIRVGFPDAGNLRIDLLARP